MNYPAIKDALKAWARAVTGLPGVVFENDPQPRSNAQMVTLNVRSVGKVGVGDKAQTYDPATKTITETASTNHQLYLTFQVDSFDMRATNNALAVITAAQTRMQFESSLQILRDAGMSLATVSDPIDASYEWDDRVVSRYSMDVVLNTTSALEDVPLPTIETVDVSGQLLDAQGNVLPG